MNGVSYLKIGELAQETGLSVGNLRYYSDLGLLNPVKRGENGYRYYSSDASQQVEFIKKAQAIGFSLEEIKQILEIQDRGETPCQLVRQLLDHKIEELNHKIEQMMCFKAELEGYRDEWLTYPHDQLNPLENCPLISTVSLKTSK
ncbi:MAG: heavy metal-responsive transcriptional regulator [Microcystaceae cyanobacterium]